MDLDSVKRGIKPLDLLTPPHVTTQELEYFQHYEINFEEKIDDVEHYFGSIKSDQFEISTHFFSNKQADKTCFILHGYYDHSGLFGRLLEYCLKRNFSVVIFDLPGHGLSTGAAATIEDFSIYQKVLSDIVDFFSDKTPLPWNAIAQSTGGAILSEFMLSNTVTKFRQSVMLAPLIYPVKWRASKLSHNLLKKFIKKIPRNFSDNSGDENFLRFLEHDDPLQARDLPLQWVGALARWIDLFIALPSNDSDGGVLNKVDKDEANRAPLIIQGQCDGTVDWKKNLPIYQQKFPNLETCLIPSGKHQLANEMPIILSEIYAAMDKYFEIRSQSNSEKSNFVV